MAVDVTARTEMESQENMAVKSASMARYFMDFPAAIPVQGHPVAGFPMRLADFGTMSEALDYAVLAGTGLNFYDVRGNLEHSLNYDDIRYRARQLARCMIAKGLERGDRVGVVAEMDPDFVCMFFACQYAGLVAVPLPVITGLGGRHGYEKQLHNVLHMSGAKLVTGPEALRKHLTEAAIETEVRDILTVEELLDLPRSQEPLEPLRADEISHIQYSSGSTHHPKGIEITQKALMANARSISHDALKFTNKERVASWLPFYHDMGLIGCLTIPVTCQMTVDYLHTDAFARRPLQWLKMISDNRCTISFSPTFGYEICARRAARKNELEMDLSHWRVAGIGGEMIQGEILEEFYNVFSSCGFKREAFVPSYGLAEATLAFSFVKLEDSFKVDRVNKQALLDDHVAVSLEGGTESDAVEKDYRDFVSCGFPMPEYGVDVRDEDGNSVPERQVGCLYIKGPSLMQGYFNNAMATRDCMDGEWLNTGDMGYMADGELYITGRQKDLIIINGRNIWPQDMEWHAESNIESLRSRSTAAFSIEGPDGKERPVILVECRLRDAQERADLKKEVQMVIRRNTGIDCLVELIPARSLPLTTSGKLSRAKAKKAYMAGEYAVAEDMADITAPAVASVA